jgi:hypothetical protein
MDTPESRFDIDLAKSMTCVLNRPEVTSSIVKKLTCILYIDLAVVTPGMIIAHLSDCRNREFRQLVMIDRFRKSSR